MGIAYTMPHLWKEDEPTSFDPLKYDPQFGFQDRKERELPATLEEMESANLEPFVRDYCAHKTMLFRACMSYYAPVWYPCKGLEEELKECHLQERVHDMKEYERERRLNVRERRIRNKAAQE